MLITQRNDEGIILSSEKRLNRSQLGKSLNHANVFDFERRKKTSLNCTTTINKWNELIPRINVTRKIILYQIWTINHGKLIYSVIKLKCARFNLSTLWFLLLLPFLVIWFFWHFSTPSDLYLSFVFAFG